MNEQSIVLITGAASGIGLATARLFLEEGACVVGADLDEPALLAAARGLGPHFTAKTCDVMQEQDILRLARYVEEAHGRLDILVNNAGMGKLVNIEQVCEEDFQMVFGVNLKGPMLLVKHFVPLLRKSSHPSIVNVSSSAARVEHTQNHFLYSTAKAALLKFTLHLVRDLPGIRANAVLPGWIDTAIYRRAGLDDATIGAIYDRAVTRIPAGRIGRPEDIAHAILFLSSDKASYINGASLDIHGGLLCNADWGFLF